MQCIAVLAAEASVYSWTYTVMPCGHAMQTDRVTVAVCTARTARRGGTGCYQAGQNAMSMSSAAASGKLRQLSCWCYQSPVTSHQQPQQKKSKPLFAWRCAVGLLYFGLDWSSLHRHWLRLVDIYSSDNNIAVWTEWFVLLLSETTLPYAVCCCDWVLHFTYFPACFHIWKKIKKRNIVTTYWWDR